MKNKGKRWGKGRQTSHICLRACEGEKEKGKKGGKGGKRKVGKRKENLAHLLLPTSAMRSADVRACEEIERKKERKKERMKNDTHISCYMCQ